MRLYRHLFRRRACKVCPKARHEAWLLLALARRSVFKVNYFSVLDKVRFTTSYPDLYLVNLRASRFRQRT